MPPTDLVSKIIAELGRVRDAGPVELESTLGISKATLSRAMAEVGDRVYRMGRGRAVRYARTRELPRVGTHAPVYRVDSRGKASRLGDLQFLAGGHHWLALEGSGIFYEGLPPFGADMAPSGYLGRGFAQRHPELELPPRINDWNDDHRLIALARRGEDCVGNLIVGDESFERFAAHEPQTETRRQYPHRAEQSLLGNVGSSAGGEHPKFGAFTKSRHVLVKFAGKGSGDVARRWRDLLWCEWLALRFLRKAKIEAAEAELFDVEGSRFLEVERFDRVGDRGRIGVISLAAVDSEYFGYADNWTKAALRLERSKKPKLSRDDARRMRWVDAFGQLIGNSDRHFGNLSFFTEDFGVTLKLAPLYDMLPMTLAPSATSIVERPFSAQAPTGDAFDVWPDAAEHAVEYWKQVAAATSLDGSVRRFAKDAWAKIETARERIG